MTFKDRLLLYGASCSAIKRYGITLLLLLLIIALWWFFHYKYLTTGTIYDKAVGRSERIEQLPETHGEFFACKTVRDITARLIEYITNDHLQLQAYQVSGQPTNWCKQHLLHAQLSGEFFTIITFLEQLDSNANIILDEVELVCNNQSTSINCSLTATLYTE